MAKDPNRPLDYLVLPVAALRTATGGLPAETLGILLQLLIRAATDLTGGRIDNAAATTNAPQCNIPGIWHWEGHALVLDIYPADYEAKALAKRYSYAANASSRWQKSHPSPTACNGMQTTLQLHADSAAIASPPMPLHAISCNGMQTTMQFPHAPARGIDSYLYEGGKKEHTPEHTAQANLPHPPTNNEKFNQWWRIVAATHPTGKHLHALPYDIALAAWDTYQCLPDIRPLAPLLADYMGSKLQCNKYGQRYYRASGIARYFATLTDHITHAERWAAETGYHRKQAAKAPPKSKPATPPEPEDTLSPDDLKNFFDTIRKNDRPEPPEPADSPAEPTTGAPETPTGLD